MVQGASAGELRGACRNQSAQFQKLRTDIINWPLMEQYYAIETYIWSHWVKYKSAGMEVEFHEWMQGHIAKARELGWRLLEFAVQSGSHPRREQDQMLKEIEELLGKVYAVASAINAGVRMAEMGVTNRFPEIVYGMEM